MTNPSPEALGGHGHASTELNPGGPRAVETAKGPCLQTAGVVPLRGTAWRTVPLGEPGGWEQEKPQGKFSRLRGLDPPARSSYHYLSQARLEVAAREPGKPAFRAQLAGGYYVQATARRKDRREVRGISYDSNRGRGYDGGPAA